MADKELDKLMKRLNDHFYPTKEVTVKEFLDVFGLGGDIDHYQKEGSNYVKKEKENKGNGLSDT